MSEPGVTEQTAQRRPIKAQSAAVARATASICNAEWAPLGGMSGHDGLTHTFPGLSLGQGLGLGAPGAVQGDAPHHAQDAGADALVALLLVLAQEHIAVVDFALDGQHIHRAEAAFAALAVAHHLDAGGLQCVEQGFPGGHGQRCTMPGHGHGEGLRGPLPAAAEGFEAQAAGGAACLRPQRPDRPEQAGGPAHVARRTGRQRGNLARQIQTFALPRHRQHQAIAQGVAQALRVSQFPGAARGVEQAHSAATPRQGLGHGHHRRDADAAGHKQARGRVDLEREVVLRRAHRQRVAFGQRPHRQRATTPLVQALDGDAIGAGRVGGLAHERVGAGLLTARHRHTHLQVRARRPGDGRAVQRLQQELAHGGGEVAQRGHARGLPERVAFHDEINVGG